MYAKNRFGKERRDGDYLNLPTKLLLRRHRNCIGDNNLPYRRIAESFQYRPHEHSVRHANVCGPGAGPLKPLHLFIDCAARCDFIVNENGRLTPHIANNLNRFNRFSAHAATAFVHERQWKPKYVHILFRQLGAPDIRGDNDAVFNPLFSKILRQRCDGSEMIRRNIEKPLNLSDVQVNSNHAMRAGNG